MDTIHNPVPREAATKQTVNAVLGHVTQVGNSIVSLLSGLLSAVLILYSSYVLYDTFYTETTANSAWELLRYRSEIIDDGATPLNGAAALVAINEDYRAWLTLYGTNIDYPIMQGEDDLYYASHDVYGEVSITGAIYMAAANSRGMSDSYNLIYGHHMDNGAMFGALDEFKVEDYVNKHREGVLVTSSGVYDLTVFAVAYTDAYESQIYTVGNRAEAVRAFLEASVNGGPTTQTIYYDAETAATADRIVALSTCRSAETNGRLVVFAKMSRHDLITLQATGYGNTYDAQPHGLTQVQTNYTDGTVVEYSIDGGQTWTTVPPTLTNVGTLVVTVRATNEIYGTTETTETIQVNPAPITVTVLNATKIAGTDDPEYRAVVTGLLDDFKVVYTITRPGAGTDEDAGEYEGAIIANGEQLQGNYSVTYLPGTLTITEAEEVIDDLPPALSAFTRPFLPRGTSGQGRAWALVNLICVILTAYLLLPVTHLKAKYGRAKKMKKLNESKIALREALELDANEQLEKQLIEEQALQDRQARNERLPESERLSALEPITEQEFTEAVYELFYKVKEFIKRFRIGVTGETLTTIAAIIAFILTEDMRAPMVLIDRWTPLMLILLLICWVIDVRLTRYRGGVLAEKEKNSEEKAVATA